MKIFLISIFLILNIIIINAQNGVITGKVIDKKTNEGIPFANIIIDGTTIGSVSDLDGKFLFTGVKPGFIKLVASFIGYKPQMSDEIQVTNTNKPYIEIYLDPTSQTISEVKVVATVLEKDNVAPVSMRKISISEIETNPGSNRDFSKVIQSFPGVGFVPSFRNDIIIRGGGPAENVYYLDEVEIPNINHFGTQGASGGAVGIINADLLQSADFLSGAFPANRANTLSSVFDLKQKQGNKEKPKYRVSIGASETAISSDGPVGKKSNYILSIRRSYLQFLFDAIGLPFLPTFNDYQLKWETKFNSKNELKIISIGALDEFKLNTSIKNPTESQEYILGYLPVNEQWSYTIGGVYKHFGKENVTTLVLSRNMLNNTSYKYPENNELQNKILDYRSQEVENKIRLENTRYLKKYRLNFGLNAEYAKYNNSTVSTIFLNSQILNLAYYTNIDIIKYGAFIQLNRGFFNDRFIASAGIRTDANNYSDNMANLLNQLSPRISFSYQISEKISLTFNTGRYYKLPAYTSLGYKNNSNILVNKENNIKYIKVDHLIGGIDYKYNKDIIFTLEGFYKKYANYPFSVRDSIALASKGSDFGVVGDEEILSISEGRAYGLEFSNRTVINKKINLIFSYTYVISEFKDIDGEYIPTSWDSRHIISTTGTRFFEKNWSLGFKWRYSGGTPYTPYNLALSSQKDAWDTQGKPFLDYDKLNSVRLKPFHQLDIRVDKKYYYKKWSLMLYLDIQNAYNFKIQQPDYIIRQKDNSGNYIITNSNEYILKNIKNTSGTLLPTIGIMAEF